MFFLSPVFCDRGCPCPETANHNTYAILGPPSVIRLDETLSETENLHDRVRVQRIAVRPLAIRRQPLSHTTLPAATHRAAYRPPVC